MTAPPSDSPPDPLPPRRRSLARRVLRWVLRVVAAFVAGVVLYAGTAFVLGKVPVHARWRSTPGGHVVYVLSNGVHADIVLPAVVGERDLRADYPLASGERWADWVAFGWGDRGFYLETPTWADLTLSTALRATFLPTPTLMHVSHYYGELQEGELCVRLEVRDAELAALLAWCEHSFRRDASGRPLRLEGAGYPPREGYLPYNEFFEATGSYHLFYTCNDWIARGLASAGIRAPLWSPFDRAILRQVAGR